MRDSAPAAGGGFILQFAARARYCMLECWTETVVRHRDVPGCDLDGVLLDGRDGRWSVYFAADDVQRAGQSGLTFCTTDGAIAAHERDATAAAAECLQVAARTGAVPAVMLPRDEVAHNLAEFARAYTRLQSYYQISSAPFTALAERCLSQELEGTIADPARSQRVLAVLTTGMHTQLKTFHEEVAWLDLVISAQRDGWGAADVEQALAAHEETFAYITVAADALGQDAHAAYARRWRDFVLLPLDELERRRRAPLDREAERADARAELLHSLHLSVRGRSIADSLAAMGVHRMRVREDFTQAAHRAYPLFAWLYRELERAAGELPEALLHQLSVAELHAVAGGADAFPISARKRLERGASVAVEGVRLSWTGQMARVQVEALLESESTPRPRDELHGIAGNGAEPVVGTAFVLATSLTLAEQVERASAMRRGDVLIAGMTYPSLLLACENASAIVTDFGGLTSHAVLIARELGVPCIVGTGDATTQVRTGDTVEVDSAAGVVRVRARVC